MEKENTLDEMRRFAVSCKMTSLRMLQAWRERNILNMAAFWGENSILSVFLFKLLFLCLVVKSLDIEIILNNIFFSKKHLCYIAELRYLFLN